MSGIALADSDAQILGCFPVMQQLRTHLEQQDFLSKVRRQQLEGYRLVCLEDDGSIRAVAGFRVVENLASGRMLYVDDLVTDSAWRSRGYGKALLDWLIDQARREQCQFLDLDSGVQRFDAHRFYLSNRLIISSHHFKLKL
jgi:GNAT superfamily N-acetyltransferase